mmetsp:Transcript_27420/g.45355  ORF Transcript_27420/g.45355 Transcript_27420/m.45355 type:complete len:82 (+) Transcript_27420:739-984(+)
MHAHTIGDIIRTSKQQYKEFREIPWSPCHVTAKRLTQTSCRKAVVIKVMDIVHGVQVAKMKPKSRKSSSRKINTCWASMRR